MTAPHGAARLPLSLAFAAALLSGCSATPPATPGQSRSQAHAVQVYRIAQTAFGPLAVFEHCRAHDCPERTPKTLPVPTPVAAISNPVLAPALQSVLPLTEGLSLGESMLGDEAAAPERAASNLAENSVSVLFPFASAALTPAAQALLRDLAPRLVSSTRITLSGHTDSSGPAAANQALSAARARAVRDALVSLSPALAPLLTVQARGNCCFVEPNDGPQGRARNRRVEISYAPDAVDEP